jgi:hypothetical protein
MTMDERRQAFRMRAEPGFDQVVIQLRGKDLRARLSDTSASGLSVICDRKTAIEPGELLKIRTDAGWFTATAKWVESTPAGVVAGLERVEDLPDPKVPWITEAGLIPFAFVGIVLAVPLLRLTWEYCLPGEPTAANSPQPAQFAAPPAANDVRQNAPSGVVP